MAIAASQQHQAEAKRTWPKFWILSPEPRNINPDRRVKNGIGLHLSNTFTVYTHLTQLLAKICSYPARELSIQYPTRAP